MAHRLTDFTSVWDLIEARAADTPQARFVIDEDGRHGIEVVAIARVGAGLDDPFGVFPALHQRVVRGLRRARIVEADCDRDNWMNGDEAKEYGLIDEVLDRANPKKMIG